MSGTPLFAKVLIANRGEIALRVLRSLRQAGIASVAIYHHSDCDAPLLSLADEAVEITGESATAAYLDGEQIIAICQQRGVDAVHPGYGFLAENADFARALAGAGIRFVGPEPDVIELMGDKIRSRQFVAEHGFPVPPAVELDVDDSGFMDAVADMPLPLVIKASAGGGGKGMSIVRSLDELKGAITVAASEAQTYFGDRRVYVERYFESVRHIEVQLLGDGKNVVHLGERECSVQRRFQKIIEESPSPALSGEKREAICSAAVGIAKAANYSNAGTVEFLYTPQGEFFFLEMNTRIQVEHPITEVRTGIDLVDAQLQIAAGQPLAMRQDDIAFTGHAIECRICAEDASQDFIPETGRVLFLSEPEGEGIRCDSGLYSKQQITTHFDPMLSKLVVHAGNRESAIQRAVDALRQYVVLGVHHNIDFLAELLQDQVFASGDYDTGFIARYFANKNTTETDGQLLQAVLAAALLNDREVKQFSQRTPAPYRAIGHWRN